jgi:hypothetical protein
VPIDRPLGDAAVLPQPVLELHHTPVEHWGRARCLLLHDPALAEELDEPAHAPHVLHGDMRLTTITGAAAAMPREPLDNGFVDVGDRDLGQRQPMREVAGCTVVAPHCQGSMPRVRQMARELRHPWGKVVRMHAPPPGASILIRIGHSMLPSRCHQAAREAPNYAEPGSGLLALSC